jgi:hypothetical protein
MTEEWYIVKNLDGHCEILAAPALESKAETLEQTSSDLGRWGPFPSQSEAIARRVGLIRAGKCQPV